MSKAKLSIALLSFAGAVAAGVFLRAYGDDLAALLKPARYSYPTNHNEGLLIV